MDGCVFNPLMAIAEQTGWVLSQENCGQTIAAEEAFDIPPVIFYHLADPLMLYTLAFVDLDGADEENRVYLHWLVVNVPESALAQGMTYMDGDTVMDYLAPDPGTYEHRYGLYLYEQVYGTTYPPLPNVREEFDLTGWINSIFPEGALCGPVASIGFNA
ncbi:39S ribosomal protein L38, mitochondrial-like [Wyeomyia smithii]|uniref:39S ribosomal protein L38, mitochondrial-like n=1 Tax=Wyeomyia smithii TaxID=174621 RepID=UPI002468076B|nr:39S ribosomal protein L38, mitochondrial-like [Wyeomyia smithii]